MSAPAVMVLRKRWCNQNMQRNNLWFLHIIYIELSHLATMLDCNIGEQLQVHTSTQSLQCKPTQLQFFLTYSSSSSVARMSRGFFATKAATCWDSFSGMEPKWQSGLRWAFTGSGHRENFLLKLDKQAVALSQPCTQESKPLINRHLSLPFSSPHV